MSFISRLGIAWHALVALSFTSLVYAAPAHAADPAKVGVSLSLTGGVASNGKQILMALELWRDDVNAKGGLLGRPVEIVYYDDQSSPSNVPALYTKLITVDKVDLLLGPYATNMVAPAMPVIMQNNKTTISFLAIGINRLSTIRNTSPWSRSGRRDRVRSRTASSSSRRHSHRSRRPSRSCQPMRSSPRPPPTPHATTRRQRASRSFTTDHCPTNDASPCRNARHNDRILDACRLPAVSSRPRKTVRWDLVEIAASRTEEGDRELICNDCLDSKSIRQCERVLTLCPRTADHPREVETHLW
jgi:hypothetical protein